jgi:hypothetical protein
VPKCIQNTGTQLCQSAYRIQEHSCAKVHTEYRYTVVPKCIQNTGTQLCQSVYRIQAHSCAKVHTEYRHTVVQKFIQNTGTQNMQSCEQDTGRQDLQSCVVDKVALGRFSQSIYVVSVSLHKYSIIISSSVISNIPRTYWQLTTFNQPNTQHSSLDI